jgi:hypothetical protein
MASEDETGYPPLPLNLLEILAFSKLSRVVGTDIDQQLQQQQQQHQGSAAADGSNSSSSSGSSTLHMRTINLVTLQHDVVRPEFWAEIAGHITLGPQQRQQLEAGWALYVRAMQKLNAGRQQLRQQLQRAIDSSAAAGDAAADASTQPLQQADASVLTGITKFQGVGALGAPLPSSSNAALALGKPNQVHNSSSSMAAGMAATVLRCGGNVPGCFAVQRLCSGSASCVQQELEALADAVERSLMQGRAVITAFGWSQMMALDNEQMAAMIVAGFPYLPLIRGVVGHLLGKPEMQQQPA